MTWHARRRAVPFGRDYRRVARSVQSGRRLDLDPDGRAAVGGLEHVGPATDVTVTIKVVSYNIDSDCWTITVTAVTTLSHYSGHPWDSIVIATDAGKTVVDVSTAYRQFSTTLACVPGGGGPPTVVVCDKLGTKVTTSTPLAPGVTVAASCGYGGGDPGEYILEVSGPYTGGNNGVSDISITGSVLGGVQGALTIDGGTISRTMTWSGTYEDLTYDEPDLEVAITTTDSAGQVFYETKAIPQSFTGCIPSVILGSNTVTIDIAHGHQIANPYAQYHPGNPTGYGTYDQRGFMTPRDWSNLAPRCREFLSDPSGYEVTSSQPGLGWAYYAGGVAYDGVQCRSQQWSTSPPETGRYIMQLRIRGDQINKSADREWRFYEKYWGSNEYNNPGNKISVDNGIGDLFGTQWNQAPLGLYNIMDPAYYEYADWFDAHFMTVTYEAATDRLRVVAH
jgi:hypothetical protein